MSHKNMGRNKGFSLASIIGEKKRKELLEELETMSLETKHKITGHPVDRRIYDTKQKRWIVVQRYYNGKWIDV